DDYGQAIRDLWRCFQKQASRHSFPEQTSQRIVSFVGRREKRAKRSDIRGKLSRQFAALRKGSLAGSERVPYHIVKRMHAVLDHRSRDFDSLGGESESKQGCCSIRSLR